MKSVAIANTILETYGWSCHPEAGCHPEHSEGSPGIALKHNFYEVDYLPENDRIRYTIHPEARKEILKRLLELNHQIHEEEVVAGLWDKKKPANKKTNTYKTNPTTNTVAEPEEGYGQGKLNFE